MTFELPHMFGKNTFLFKQNFSRPFARLQLRLPKFNFNKIIPFLLLGIIVLIIISIGVKNLGKKVTPDADARIEIKNSKATQQINREFSFPLKDDKGKVVTTIKYTIESAELRDEIVVKGQRATSVQGRTFLIIPLKINNDYSKGIEIQAKDYIRLVLNGKDTELLAADIHSDPVTVQALSTKQTRIGFPINDTDRNLILKVGELSGTKEDIVLTIQ